MFCDQCGQPIEQGNRFCAECGAPVDVPVAPTPVLPVMTSGPHTPLVTSGPPKAAVRSVPPQPAVRSVPPQPASPPPANVRPAGLWRRFFALLVDVGVLWLLLFPYGLLTTALTNYAVGQATLDPGGQQLREIMATYQTFAFAGALVLLWAYFAILEACPLQATVGKRLLGVRLTQSDGRRLPLWRSTLRLLFKSLSAAPFLLGFLIAGLNRRKRALHDMLSGSYAVRR